MKKEKSPWQVLESRYVHRSAWLTARQEKIRLQNGNVIPEYYVLEYPDWVNTLAVTTEGRFIFVRQYRHGLGQASYELCAGVRDPEDATPMDAARRELMEETGYGGGQWECYMTLSANPGTHTNLTYCFLATGVEKLAEAHLEPTEELSVHLLSADEVKALLLGNEIKQALHAAPLWKYMAVNHLL